MARKLDGKKVAILVADGFEQVRGRKMTSWRSRRGQRLGFQSQAGYIPAFNRKMIEEFAEGRHRAAFAA